MLRKIQVHVLVLIGMAASLVACQKDYEYIENIDDAKISEYISKNGVSAVKDPEGSGYYYQIVSQGEGDLFKTTDSVRYVVTVKSLLNGTTYYTSPEYVNLGTFVGYTDQLLGIKIKAILTTMQKIGPGGTVRIILPSYLAFGKNGMDILNIPSNEILDLTVKTYAETQAEIDDMHIRSFLTANNITATKDASGVYYVLADAGSGEPVKDIYSNVTTKYAARNLGGNVFNSSDAYTGLLGGNVDGWRVLTKFKQGAKLRLFVPSVLAYGTDGQYDSYGATVVPPNGSLDFDIEITSVVN
ncbi:FKBP-type peptidyl-prolyl cis-trans isomerase [Pedobacter deserti]|uniref:FKBP-type peptidyl-prolyl cis-trans isomerase n=1 Tax=Pedobacter deserti TaxID=2817382 RepID=UPI00210D98D1|nr:FKBP-type peptidyl-prolyl cis-trans isomerase [Pedobacter sp. SYSU D00382]